MTREPEGEALDTLDELVARLTAHAHSDDEALRAFRQALADRVAVPCDAFVIDEPVSVTAFAYHGNPRRGLIAVCRRTDGSEHVVAAADVVLSPGRPGEQVLAAYRTWLGMGPVPLETSGARRSRRQHKVAAGDLQLGRVIELVALSVKDRAARCRLLASDRVITLRATRLWKIVPGEIVTVAPRKQWTYAGHPYVSGEITASRLDVAALGLVPLRLERQGTWDLRRSTGERRASRSTRGRSRSSRAGPGQSSRWSRCSRV
jgi:hypothetical protein